MVEDKVGHYIVDRDWRRENLQKNIKYNVKTFEIVLEELGLITSVFLKTCLYEWVRWHVTKGPSRNQTGSCNYAVFALCHYSTVTPWKIQQWHIFSETVSQLRWIILKAHCEHCWSVFLPLSPPKNLCVLWIIKSNSDTVQDVAIEF